jgi:hypothetical protein
MGRPSLGHAPQTARAQARARDGLGRSARTPPRERRADTRYNIYFDENVRGDRLDAEHLRGVEGVRLYRCGRGGHRLVRELRNCGALERMLREALHVGGTTIAPSEGVHTGAP